MVDLDAGDLEWPMLNSRYNLVKRRLLRALFEAPLSGQHGRIGSAGSPRGANLEFFPP